MRQNGNLIQNATVKAHIFPLKDLTFPVAISIVRGDRLIGS